MIYVLILVNSSVSTDVPILSYYSIISQCPFLGSTYMTNLSHLLQFVQLLLDTVGGNAYHLGKLVSCGERVFANLFNNAFLGTHRYFLGTFLGTCPELVLYLSCFSFILQKFPLTPYTPATTLQLPIAQQKTGGRSPCTGVILLPSRRSGHCPAHTRDSVEWRCSSACRLPPACGACDRRWALLASTGTGNRDG